MDALLAVVFLIGLPVWLVVEQILALIRSPLPAVRPRHEHLASSRPGVPYAYAENELAVTTIDAARVSNR